MCSFCFLHVKPFVQVSKGNAAFLPTSKRRTAAEAFNTGAGPGRTTHKTFLAYICRMFHCEAAKLPQGPSKQMRITSSVQSTRRTRNFITNSQGKSSLAILQHLYILSYFWTNRTTIYQKVRQNFTSSMIKRHYFLEMIWWPNVKHQTNYKHNIQRYEGPHLSFMTESQDLVVIQLLRHIHMRALRKRLLRNWNWQDPV